MHFCNIPCNGKVYIIYSTHYQWGKISKSFCVFVNFETSSLELWKPFADAACFFSNLLLRHFVQIHGANDSIDLTVYQRIDASMTWLMQVLLIMPLLHHMGKYKYKYKGGRYRFEWKCKSTEQYSRYCPCCNNYLSPCLFVRNGIYVWVHIATGHCLLTWILSNEAKNSANVYQAQVSRGMDDYRIG